MARLLGVLLLIGIAPQISKNPPAPVTEVNLTAWVTGEKKAIANARVYVEHLKEDVSFSASGQTDKDGKAKVRIRSSW